MSCYLFLSRHILTKILHYFGYFISFQCFYSTEVPLFPGAKTTWTENLEFTGKHSYAPIPVYRVMDRQGNIILPEHEPKVSEETVVKMYKNMTLLNAMDKILYESQRQGGNLSVILIILIFM